MFQARCIKRHGCHSGTCLGLGLGNPIKNDWAEQQVHDAQEIRDLMQAQQMLVALQVALPELADIYFLVQRFDIKNITIGDEIHAHGHCCE